MATLAELAQRLKYRPDRRFRRGWPRVILVTDRRRLADPVPAARALPRSAGVILRHYGAPGRATLADRLAALCRERGLLLIVGGDAGLARRIGAAGLHLTEAEAERHARHAHRRPRRWRRFLLVTAAAHSGAALRRAARAGADAALLGPLFPTPSHPGRPGLGPARAAALIRRSPLPVYVIGGIDRANLGRIPATGAVGIAALGGLVARPAPPRSEPCYTGAEKTGKERA